MNLTDMEEYCDAHKRKMLKAKILTFLVGFLACAVLVLIWLAYMYGRYQ